MNQKFISSPAPQDTVLTTYGQRTLPAQKLVIVSRSDDKIGLPGQMECRTDRDVDDVIQSFRIESAVV